MCQESKSIPGTPSVAYSPQADDLENNTEGNQDCKQKWNSVVELTTLRVVCLKKEPGSWQSNFDFIPEHNTLSKEAWTR
jgi:hypothetical protein